MDNYNTYIDLVSKFCIMKRDGKEESPEAKKILIQTESLWDKLTEEEQCWADEQTIRLMTYLG